MDSIVIRKVATAWAVAAALIAVPHASAFASGKAVVRVRQDLSPTGVDPNAQGKVRFVLKGGNDGRLQIHTSHLDRSASFDLLADGVKVGTLQTKPGGSGKLRFRSTPSGSDNLLGFDPRGAVLTVRDEQGDDVLVGNVPDDSIDPTEIACCIPDDSGAECEDRTEADCLAAGGSVTTSNTCLPNPCADAPAPGTAVVCCTPDDSGAECEDQSEAECAAAGGTVVSATSCDPNPCAATPPAEGEIACCVPHGSEPAECEKTTPEACTALAGTPSDAASCDPDPCGGAPTPEPTVVPTPTATPDPGNTP